MSREIQRIFEARALDEMRALPGYEQLRNVCADRGVEVFESFMGLSGLAAFFWALKRGQFEDMEGAANRILTGFVR